MTKKYRTLFWVFFAISVLLNIGPLCGYTIKALIEADLTHEKVALCLTVVVVLIMSAICLINKVALKSRLWIILIGLYMCLDYILTPLIIIACCQVLDELLISPLKSMFKTKLTIHKELDKRLP
jgi:hypothetical protein